MFHEKQAQNSEKKLTDKMSEKNSTCRFFIAFVLK